MKRRQRQTKTKKWQRRKKELQPQVRAVNAWTSAGVVLYFSCYSVLKSCLCVLADHTFTFSKAAGEADEQEEDEADAGGDNVNKEEGEEQEEEEEEESKTKRASEDDVGDTVS